MSYKVNFPHGLMFHRFYRLKSQNLKVGTLNKNDLEKIINFVGRNRILNPNQWIQKINKRKLEKHHLCLTFDDGLKSQVDVALPVLNKFKIKAFWFVHTGMFSGNYDKNEIFNLLIFKKFKKFKNFFNKFLKFCEIELNVFQNNKFFNYLKSESKYSKFCTKNEIKYRYIRDVYYSKNKFEFIMEKFFSQYQLDIKKFSKNIWMNKKDIINLNKNGHMIGMHSFSHPFKLSNLSAYEQELEYRKNYNHLKSICKKRIISMSHPMNSYNHTTLKILKKMRIVCGFKGDSIIKNNKKINSSFLELPREDSTDVLKQINRSGIQNNKKKYGK